METKLSASYADPTEPGSLGGVAKFAKAHKIPVSKAKKELQQVLSYTLHKQDVDVLKRYPPWCLKSTNNLLWTWWICKN